MLSKYTKLGKTMKRFLSILLILIFICPLCLTACGVSGDEHTHAFSEWEIVKEPTCLDHGLKIRTCTYPGCNEVERTVIYTTHNYVAGLCEYCNKAKDLTNKEFDSELPTFYVYTNGVTIPDRSHPEYSNYAECEMSMTRGGGTLEFDETAKIRIRGTSSRYFAKKGYKIKFSSKKSLEGLPSSKKYNLLASYPDPCKLRDYLALSISYTMNSNSDRYAPVPVLSKVYVDDEYKGLYYLLDDVEDGTGKIELDDYSATDEKVPFVLEMDTVAYKEGVEGINYFSLGTTDVFDYNGDGWTDLLYVIDSDDNLTATQFAYVQNYVTSCRKALVDGDLSQFGKLVDVASFIDYFLLGELFRNTDMAGRSVYMYKTSVDGKLIFGPSWDFDYTCSRPYRLGPNIDYTLDNAKDRFTNYDWWSLFLQIPGADDLIKERYTHFTRDIYIHEFESAKQFYSFYETDIKLDASIWYSKDVADTNVLVDDNFKWTFDYFALRLEMMDELFLIK